MTPEEKIVYLQSLMLCAYIETQGMMALNAERERKGQAQGYSEQDFLELIDRYGIGENAVLSYLRD